MTSRSMPKDLRLCITSKEISDPDSAVRVPPRGVQLAEETGGKTKDNSTLAQANNDRDAVIAGAEGEPTSSHDPNGEHIAIFNDLSGSKTEFSIIIPSKKSEHTALSEALNEPKSQTTVGGDKGVLLGHWRDSQVPGLENKHAVIGFIDVRGRLRTRIRPVNKDWETISTDYPVPPGSGGSWVAFDDIYFSDHLVGLDQLQVKEYVRLRDAAAKNIGEEPPPTEAETVQLAIIRGRELLRSERPVVAPLIARGALHSESGSSAVIIDTERRRTQSPLISIVSRDDAALLTESSSQHPPVADLRDGSQPMRIVVGHWRGSSEKAACDRHAVYGILGQNGKFRVKIVRETRDGRCVYGNFPAGAGALWIRYEDVELESHIQDLSRPALKEYCRIRQSQIDAGETVVERTVNELRAAEEARSRITTTVLTHDPQRAPKTRSPSPQLASDGAAEIEPRSRASRRRPRRAFSGTRPTRRLLSDIEIGSNDPTGLTSNGASSGSTPRRKPSGGARKPFHEPKNLKPPNHAGARQRRFRMPIGSSDDAKIYDGFKYERKTTGLFPGSLVSQGTIIAIDSEDFVEYRVLTKPSFV
ncbi:hypothetical protein LEL_10694 [Akanthomyces lecanii RCEF 1005]|uniref:Uncharacterized protein n=1 Tax=Akanthomyces lecanii RCEF 1005 TaxID=1081108 RepID=A0A167W1S7_CORDF|nr:hypothetical protein LEL_10694 [Akanthomyces lecanii RCEF 1005]